MKKNNHKKYQILMECIILFSSGFIALMGYMNFKTTYQEISDQMFFEIANESVEKIETSLSFGKNLYNYYGMMNIFEQYRSRVGKDKALLVTDTSNEILYSTFDENSNLFVEVQQALEQWNFENFRKADANQSKSIAVGDKYYLIHLIQSDEVTIGYFIVCYEDTLLEEQLRPIQEKVIQHTLISILILLVCYIIGMTVFEKAKMSQRIKENGIKIFPVALLMCGILVQSIGALNIYQESYRESMMSGAEKIIESMEETISEVIAQGVDLAEVDGLTEYLGEKVDTIPILWNIKISEEIANASEITKRDSSLLLLYELNDKNLILEVELSSKYINDKLMQIVLVLLSTLIIMIIFIVEIVKLPQLLVYKLDEKVNTACEETYLQVGNALRLSSFLCSTAEYICVPYAAMLIRQWNESVFGLSVGMTAALPLSVEGLAQMIAMLVLPKYVQKINIKTALILSTIGMAVCNLGAFFADSALVIIIMRGIAGIAYAGFKQISNYLIVRGYENELQRSRNLSQDNAGLLAGVTCGAGLGAIICATAGYSMTFLISVVVFGAYLLVTLITVPWKLLSKRKIEEEQKENVGITKILKMIFSVQVLYYILVVGVPLNIGILLCVTLVPGICQSQGISTVFLSYCYIVNGIAGIYIGPNLVGFAKKYFGLKISIGFAFALTAVSLFILELPGIIVMLMISSMILGFLDGFATPLTIDEFMELPVVKKTVSESTALIFGVVLSYVLTTVGPMIAETMLIETEFFITPLVIGAMVYLFAAFLLFAGGINKLIKTKK